MPHALVNVLQQGLREYFWQQGALMATLCSWEGLETVCSWPWNVPSLSCVFIRLYPDFWQTLEFTLWRFDEGCREPEGADSFLCVEFGRKFWRRGWLLIRSRPPSPFHGLPVLWRSSHHFLCPSNLGIGTRHWCLAFWDVRHLSSHLVPACFPSLLILVNHEHEGFLKVDLHWWCHTICELLHHV